MFTCITIGSSVSIRTCACVTAHIVVSACCAIFTLARVRFAWQYFTIMLKLFEKRGLALPPVSVFQVSRFSFRIKRDRTRKVQEKF